MTEKTPAEGPSKPVDPSKPLEPTNPAPKGSTAPQEDDPVTARNPDNPAF